MKKTQEEYLTQAMLLDMEYSELVHCFIKTTGHDTADWFDADTMQQLATSDKLARIMEYTGERPPPYNPSTDVLIWEGKRI